MQIVQLTVWKSPPQMRVVDDLDPWPMAEAQVDDLVELSKALANPTPIQIQEKAGVSQSTACRSASAPTWSRARGLASGPTTGATRPGMAALPKLPGTRL